jgi:hemerythrin-like domain-containing protein
VTARRIRDIALICSDKLYSNEDIPLEDIEIISVVIEEFVDRFHHGKEEQAYFPQTRYKNGFDEDIRKFLIEHELGAVFITDHTGKEDNFFDTIEEKGSISDEEDDMLMRHYENCRSNVGGKERIEQMIKLIEYLENRNWMKKES